MSLYATFGDSRVAAPASISTLGSQVAAHTRALETMMSQQRDALVHNQFSASQLTTQVSKLSPEVAAQIHPHLEWMERFNTQVNTSDAIPLATAFPRLAEGVQNRDPFEVVRGLDDYGKAMTFERPGHRTLAGRLQGVLVDEQGLMTGLPDAPPLVRLLTPWGTEAGVRIRSSLNRLMVSEQTLVDQTRQRCENGTQNDCERYRQTLATFEGTYGELSLIHGLADRLALAGEPGFRFLMEQLEIRTNFYFGIAEGIAKSLGETIEQAIDAYTDPIGHVSRIAAGLKFILTNREATLRVIQKGLQNKWRIICEGSARERGELIGKIGSDLFLAPQLSLLRVTKAVVKLRVAGKIAEIARASERAGEVVEELIENGALPILREATEGAVETVATAAKIEELTHVGKITPAIAREAEALSKVFPKTVSEIIDHPKLAEGLAGVREKLAKSKPSELLQGADADRQLASLVARESADALDFIKDHGTDAAAGLAKLEGVAPGLLKEWNSSSVAELAKLSSSIAHTLKVAPATPEFKSLQNLALATKEIAAQQGVLSSATYQFLSKQVIFSRKIAGLASDNVVGRETFDRIARSYAALESKIDSVPRVTFEGVVWRGIKRTIVDAGIVKMRHISEVFQTSYYNYINNHRYSAPGEISTYTTAGPENAAKSIILDELGKLSVENVLFDSRKIKVGGILDLTDSKVLRFLGLSSDTLTSSSYETTHQLGNIARMHGFRGIKAPGSKKLATKSNPTIILFEGVLP